MGKPAQSVTCHIGSHNVTNHQWHHFSKSMWVSVILGVSVYVTYSSCNSNTVSKLKFTWEKIKIINP